MATVFSSDIGDLGFCHLPAAWAAWDPRLDHRGAERAGEDVQAHEPPLDLERLVPSGWHNKLHIQAGPATAKADRVHPRMLDPLGWKGLEKSPGVHVSCC